MVAESAEGYTTFKWLLSLDFRLSDLSFLVKKFNLELWIQLIQLSIILVNSYTVSYGKTLKLRNLCYYLVLQYLKFSLISVSIPVSKTTCYIRNWVWLMDITRGCFVSFGFVVKIWAGIYRLGKYLTPLNFVAINFRNQQKFWILRVLHSLVWA